MPRMTPNAIGAMGSQRVSRGKGVTAVLLSDGSAAIRGVAAGKKYRRCPWRTLHDACVSPRHPQDRRIVLRVPRLRRQIPRCRQDDLVDGYAILTRLDADLLPAGEAKQDAVFAGRAPAIVLPAPAETPQPAHSSRFTARPEVVPMR